MNNKKKVSRNLVVINWINAVLWYIIFFIDLANGYATAESFRMHLLCAIGWSIIAIIWTVRYLEYKRYNK